jgi:Ca2+-binding RTX toxin-like protein
MIIPGILIGRAATSDRISGTAGNDTLFGGSGSDTIAGNAGDDVIRGGRDNDFLLGGQGNDTVNGESDDDTVFGGSGDDEVIGGGGNDIVEGGYGTDTLTGGNGDDVFLFIGRTAGFQEEGAAAGSGVDIVTDFTAGDSFNLARFDAGVGFLVSQNGADAIISVDLDGDGTADYDIALVQGAIATDVSAAIFSSDDIF